MIRTKRVLAHKACMLAAAATSTAFLISYVVYHSRSGLIRFQGQGFIRPVYFTILGTHTFLAVIIVPLVIVTLLRAFRANFPAHKRIARWTLPIWGYVSVTGVIVYFLLYQIYASPAR
jgi:uncharacterized membrane protein YozB (DUF420 family)